MWESALGEIRIIVGSLSLQECISERIGLIYGSSTCEKEVKTSKRLRKSSTASFTHSTGEGQEFRNRSGDRGCNPDTVPHAQSSSRLSQLKPNSSRTLGRPLPATLFSPNRKAGGTRGTGFTCQGELGTAQRKLLTTSKLFLEMLARSQAASFPVSV